MDIKIPSAEKISVITQKAYEKSLERKKKEQLFRESARVSHVDLIIGEIVTKIEKASQGGLFYCDYSFDLKQKMLFEGRHLIIHREDLLFFIRQIKKVFINAGYKVRDSSNFSVPGLSIEWNKKQVK